MAKKEYILQELSELQSTLPGHIHAPAYTVPVGYFDGLAEQVLRRIKALEAATIAGELNHLAPVLASLPVQTPYTVPAGYFESLPELVLSRVRTADTSGVQDELGELSPLLAGLSRKTPYQVPAGYFDSLQPGAAHAETTAAGELASLSPLLSGLTKEMPYEVPAGYFENLAEQVAGKTVQEKTKVIALTSRRWFRYAVAAVVTGIIATLAFIRFGNNEFKSTSSIVHIEEKINKDLKKMSEKDLNDFLQFNAAGLEGTENVKAGSTDDVKELLKDVSESEMKTYLEETADVETDPETIMLN